MPPSVSWKAWRRWSHSIVWERYSIPPEVLETNRRRQKSGPAAVVYRTAAPGPKARPTNIFSRRIFVFPIAHLLANLSAIRRSRRTVFLVLITEKIGAGCRRRMTVPIREIISWGTTHRLLCDANWVGECDQDRRSLQALLWLMVLAPDRKVFSPPPSVSLWLGFEYLLQLVRSSLLRTRKEIDSPKRAGQARHQQEEKLCGGIHADLQPYPKRCLGPQRQGGRVCETLSLCYRTGFQVPADRETRVVVEQTKGATSHFWKSDQAAETRFPTPRQ